MIGAMIGAAGSVIGGFIGGCLALLASRRQSRREAAARRAERSHAAALAIADSAAALEGAVVTYAAGESDAIALRAAFNVFAQTAGVQTIALIDQDLRARVRNHLEWVRGFAGIASGRKIELVMVEPMRRHADALIDALDAQVNGLPLPPYEPPELGNAAALRIWGQAADRSA
jgi:hypothetical protein